MTFTFFELSHRFSRTLKKTFYLDTDNKLLPVSETTTTSISRQRQTWRISEQRCLSSSSESVDADKAATSALSLATTSRVSSSRSESAERCQKYTLKSQWLSYRTRLWFTHYNLTLPNMLTKLGERAFSYARPAAWNALPASLHDITDISKFKKKPLKTVLFERAFRAAFYCFVVTVVGLLFFYCSVFMFYCRLCKSAPGQHSRAALCKFIL